MAGDYARFGIRVNALCPGWVDTPFNEPFIGQMGGRSAIESYVQQQVPLGRWANVEEIAESILFLVSDRSSYITGQALVVDARTSLEKGRTIGSGQVVKAQDLLPGVGDVSTQEEWCRHVFSNALLKHLQPDSRGTKRGRIVHPGSCEVISMNCTGCGFDVQSGFAFCPKCGAKQASACPN
eukprot:gene27214-32782_t